MENILFKQRKYAVMRKNYTEVWCTSTSGRSVWVTVDVAERQGFGFDVKMYNTPGVARGTYIGSCKQKAKRKGSYTGVDEKEGTDFVIVPVDVVIKEKQ